MVDLIKKREKLIEEHRAQEKYDPHWKSVAASGRPISERPVAFICDDEVVVVGGCVAKLLNHLRAFVQSDKFAEFKFRAPGQAWIRHSLMIIDRVLARPEAAEVRVPQQWWNGIMAALAQEGLGLDFVLTDGKE